MKKRVMARARVQVTVEIDGGGPWGTDCTMEQVHRQAAETAVNFLNSMPYGTVRIIGEPRVIAVLAEVEER